MWKQFSCRARALCALAVLAAALLPWMAQAAPGDEIIFVAIDERVLPLTADTMPVWRAGVLYVPYTVFDYARSGISLSVNVVVYQGDPGRVTLFNRQFSLTFNADTGQTVNNKTGQTLYISAIYRNGTVYLPALATARFFGIGTCYRPTDSGPVLRLKSPLVYLDDDFFFDAATRTLEDYRAGYLKSIAPSPSPSLSPSPSPSPSPTPTPQPSPGVTPPVTTKRDVQVYLAFRHVSGGDMEPILDLLDRQGLRCLLLFSPQELRQVPDTVRRAVGTGHTVALAVEQCPPQELLAELSAGNRLLEELAWTRTRVAAVPQGEGEALAREAAWLCWTETVDGSAGRSSSASALADSILRQTGARRSAVYLTMDDSALSAQALPLVLSALERQEYDLRSVSETRL